jgi:transposase
MGSFDMAKQMELTQAQYKQIADLLPRQCRCGNMRTSHRCVLNAILYVAANGCKWRDLPDKYGKWNSIYVRMMRWSRSGVLDRVFERLQIQPFIRPNIGREHVDVKLTSYSIGVNPSMKSWLRRIGPARVRQILNDAHAKDADADADK